MHSVRGYRLLNDDSANMLRQQRMFAESAIHKHKYRLRANNFEANLARLIVELRSTPHTRSNLQNEMADRRRGEIRTDA